MHRAIWGWQVSKQIPWRLPKLKVRFRSGKFARRKITWENTTFICSPLLSHHIVSIPKYNCIETWGLANRKKLNAKPQTMLYSFLFRFHLAWQEFPRLTRTSTCTEPVSERVHKCTPSQLGKQIQLWAGRFKSDLSSFSYLEILGGKSNFNSGLPLLPADPKLWSGPDDILTFGLT